MHFQLMWLFILALFKRWCEELSSCFRWSAEPLAQLHSCWQHLVVVVVVAVVVVVVVVVVVG